ncbi:carboxypeptidase D-like protein [Leptotrombidium deliense]|uniref:Carboxypeptidase D-like protein n=1 Tax=Leptotrombidium deliense TaxID=299467 RepID=A0A443SM24_9ACAR|nr:carboxypeptidase D-like protein [Leptotrombidium deliense]
MTEIKQAFFASFIAFSLCFIVCSQSADTGKSRNRNRNFIGSTESDLTLSDVEKNFTWKYYNYEQLTNFVGNASTKYPKLCHVYSIGRSVKNRDLWVMKITKDVNKHVLGKPMFKYVANIHGNEALGRQYLIYLAEYLLSSYGKDKRVTEIVDSTDIHLLFSINPDGFETATEGDCTGYNITSSRRNANGVDLNRDFPDQFEHLSKNKFDIKDLVHGRQPETVAVMTWIVSNPFVLSASLHGGSVVASYPFDDSAGHVESGTPSLSPDDTVF